MTDPSSEIKNELAEFFINSAIPHGEFFDDGRRWCAGCEKPRKFSAILVKTRWMEKACPVCSAIWPEYIEEFIQDVLEDEDMEDEFPNMTLN